MTDQDNQPDIWPESKLQVLQIIWFMLVGTLLILGAMFWLIPHLSEDQILSRDDIYVVAGFVLFGCFVAVPDKIFRRLGMAYDWWKNRK